MGLALEILGAVVVLLASPSLGLVSQSGQGAKLKLL